MNSLFFFLLSLLPPFSFSLFDFRRNEHRMSTASKLLEIRTKKIRERSRGLNLFFASLHESEMDNNKAELLRDGNEITTDRDLSPSRGMTKWDFTVSNKLLLPCSLFLSC